MWGSKEQVVDCSARASKSMHSGAGKSLGLIPSLLLTSCVKLQRNLPEPQSPCLRNGEH